MLSEYLAEKRADDEVACSEETQCYGEQERGVEAFPAGRGRSDAQVHREEVVNRGLEKSALGFGGGHSFVLARTAHIIAARKGSEGKDFCAKLNRATIIYNRLLMNVLKELFERHFHSAASLVRPVQGELGGSGRTIVRLANEKFSAIGVHHDVKEENAAFLEFSKHFRRHGLAVPEIYSEDLSQGAYLEEDLGDTTLFEFLSLHRAGGEIAPVVVEAYRKVVEELPRFQVEAGRDLNYKVCYPRASFDRQSIAWDLNYFKYYFLRLAAIPFNEQALEEDFSRLTKFLLSADRSYFLYRDFQSRNIMLRDGAALFPRLPGRPPGRACNMTSPRFCSTARPICRRSCASNCWTIISTRWPDSST